MCACSHARARQAVFVFHLHPFTHLLHFSLDQSVKCEDFDEFVFTVSSRAPIFHPHLDEMERNRFVLKKILPTSSPDGLI
jgi:hypothetical protein